MKIILAPEEADKFLDLFKTIWEVAKDPNTRKPGDKFVWSICVNKVGHFSFIRTEGTNIINPRLPNGYMQWCDIIIPIFDTPRGCLVEWNGPYGKKDIDWYKSELHKRYGIEVP